MPEFILLTEFKNVEPGKTFVENFSTFGKCLDLQTKFGPWSIKKIGP
jgi:hypothetical protein